MALPLEQRHPEIDLLRGAAVTLMVVYHGVYDLSAFYGWAVDPMGGWWWALARATATLFLVVVGLSDALSAARKSSRRERWKRALRRAAVVGACALAVTAVTTLALPDRYVIFGILHCIAVTSLLLPLVDGWRPWMIAVAAAWCLLGGIWSIGQTVGTWLLLPLGFMPAGFTTIDYFPLLPWLAAPLAGRALAEWWGIAKRPPLPRPVPAWLTWPGRHALGIYLLHQPALLAVFTALLGFPR